MVTKKLIPDIIGVYTTLMGYSISVLENKFNNENDFINFLKNYEIFIKKINSYTRKKKYFLDNIKYRMDEIFDTKDFQNYFKYPNLINFLKNSLEISNTDIYLSELDGHRPLSSIEKINECVDNFNIDDFLFNIRIDLLLNLNALDNLFSSKEKNSSFETYKNKICKIKLKNFEDIIKEKLKTMIDKIIIELLNRIGLPEDGDIHKTLDTYIKLNNLKI